MTTVYLSSHYGYRLFMDDFGDDWCATLSLRNGAWVVVALGPVNGVHKPKKGK